MEIANQITQICLETDNEWFLTHRFPQIALRDLKLKESFEKRNIFGFDERKCVCLQGKECTYCYIEDERSDNLDELKLDKFGSNIYDSEKCVYTKSKWIIPENTDGEIPGFILMNCCGNKINDEEFTHELVFACVRHKYRKRGILKNMVDSIPREWNVWLEANSNDIENIGSVWEKCGFSYHTTIHQTSPPSIPIYVKSAF